MWGCPCSHCCSMASLCSSADWACMACSWWAADMGVGCPQAGLGVGGACQTPNSLCYSKAKAVARMRLARSGQERAS